LPPAGAAEGWFAEHGAPDDRGLGAVDRVKDWDGLELAKKFPDFAKACNGLRNTPPTSRRSGWWAWVIPLKGGDVSVGVVFDQRLLEWPEGGSLGQRLKDFLCQHPAGRELMPAHNGARATCMAEEPAVFSTTFAGDGFALAGDAAAFSIRFTVPAWIGFRSRAGPPCN